VNAKLWKIIKGAMIAAIGAVAATVASPDLNWGSTAPWLVAAITTGINIVWQLVRSIPKGSAVPLILLGMLGGTSAQAQTASEWSYGPTIPFFTGEFDSISGFHGSTLAAGAGVSLKRNFAPNDDGSVRMLSVGFPVFLNYLGGDASAFRLMAGATVGTFNDLIAAGVAFKFVDASQGGAPRGLADGFDRDDIVLLVSFNLNLGGGSAEAPPRTLAGIARKAVQPAPKKSPPNYVRLW